MSNLNLKAARQAFFAATGRDLHIDTFLSQIAIDHQPQNLIADKIFPVVPVLKQSDVYPVFSRADNLRIENTLRAPKTAAKLVDRNVSSGTYFAKNYALASETSIEDLANADAVHRAKLGIGQTQFLVGKLGLDRERRIANLVTSGSNVGSYSGVNTAWTVGSGNVLTDLNAAIDHVTGMCGIRPNRILMGNNAWKSARREPGVINLINGANNGKGYPTREQFKALLEIDELIIGDAYFNSANQAQAESLTSVWNDHVLVYFAPSAPSTDMPSLGYTLRWQVPGAPSFQVERHPYDSHRKVEKIEVGVYDDEKITGAEYGYLIRSVNSSTGSGL